MPHKYMIKIFTFPYMRDIALALLLYYIKMDTLQFQANILIVVFHAKREKLTSKIQKSHFRKITINGITKPF